MLVLFLHDSILTTFPSPPINPFNHQPSFLVNPSYYLETSIPPLLQQQKQQPEDCAYSFIPFLSPCPSGRCLCLLAGLPVACVRRIRGSHYKPTPTYLAAVCSNTATHTHIHITEHSCRIAEKDEGTAARVILRIHTHRDAVQGGGSTLNITTKNENRADLGGLRGRGITFGLYHRTKFGSYIIRHNSQKYTPLGAVQGQVLVGVRREGGSILAVFW